MCASLIQAQLPRTPFPRGRTQQVQTPQVQAPQVQNPHEPEWKTQVGAVEVNSKKLRTVFGIAYDVPENSEKGKFNIVAFACNEESLQIDLEYRPVVNNSPKTTGPTPDEINLTGKVILEYPEGQPYRPKNQMVVARTFRAANLNYASVFFSNVSQRDEMDIIGGMLSNRSILLDPTGENLKKIRERMQHALQAGKAVDTLTSATTAKMIHFSLPEVRYAPTLSFPPIKLSKMCGFGNELQETSGSAADFVKQLSVAVPKAAREHGLDPADLAAEQKWIIEAVNTCASLTPQQAKDVINPRSLQITDRKYQHCNAGTLVSPLFNSQWDANTNWGITLFIIPPNSDLRNEGPLQVSVQLTPPRNYQNRMVYNFLSSSVSRNP
jgi:hypothetical protein